MQYQAIGVNAAGDRIFINTYAIEGNIKFRLNLETKRGTIVLPGSYETLSSAIEVGESLLIKPL